jgi:trans-aconitate methyltransferase
MATYTIDAWAWQESWDRQQEGFMPDREHRIATVLDVVDAVVEGSGPRVLDLAGGTGSISLRALRRFPDADVTVLDLDPVLLAIAEASLHDRASIVAADLNDPDWRAGLPHRAYDAVVTATALHWIAADRLTALYAEIHDLLRPGGVFVNVDHMPDDALPTLTASLRARAEARRSARHAAGAVPSWKGWWDTAAADPVLAPLVEKRRQIYPTGHSPEWNPPASWHLRALETAGFGEVGVVWRGGPDAAVAALR